VTANLEPPRLRLVFLGTPEAAVPTLRAVHAAGHEVRLVVTNPDRRKGRGGKTAPSPVKEAALELGLPVFQPENLNTVESGERLVEAAVDILLIVAYGKILRKSVLAIPRLLPLNLHFSLLPLFRGAAPVSKAIAEGCTETGVTLQRVVKKLDAGPILTSERVAIDPEEKAGDLMRRLAEIGARLTVSTLARVAEGKVTETPQDEEQATFAPMLTKEDGRIDWTWPATKIHAHVRAMDPWPGATTTYRSAARDKTLPLTVLSCRRAQGSASASPGTVTAVDPEGIVVQTGDGLLSLTLLKPAGKRALSPREFQNGYRAVAGDDLGRDEPRS
jgi:methionyl-tRNA formyltransferase